MTTNNSLFEASLKEVSVKNNCFSLPKMIYNLALLGDPVEHSLSPQIHHKFFEASGLKGGYLCIHTAPANLPQTIKHLKELNFSGVNLTIPHKQAGLQIANEASEEAKLIGACNTLLFNKDKSIKAENTDWIGFLQSLPENTRQQSKKAVILGAGGSARAIAMALNKLQIPEIILLVRETSTSQTSAQSIVQNFSSESCEFSIGSIEAPNEVIVNADLIINTTPIGMHGSDEKQSPLPEACFKNIQNSNCYFYDLIYNPTETQLMRLAKERGFVTQNGYKMLQLQAAYAFSLWTGVDVELLKKCI